MDPRFVATLALRLLGIFAILQSFAGLAVGIAWIVTRTSGETAIGSGGGMIGLLGVELAALGACLVLFAPRLGRRMAGANEGSEPAPGPSNERIEVIGYRLLGVYAIVSHLPRLLSTMAWRFPLGEGALGAWVWRDLAGELAGVGLGIWLLLGARGLAALLDRLRGTGLKEDERQWKQRPVH